MTTGKLQKIVIVCGPTCSGKTSLGIELAQRFNAEIVSADSQQVYKFADIVTAKPTTAEQRTIRHHLIDIVEPSEHFDVARFVSLADEAIDDVISRGKNVIVVGGTGLYIKALLHGLAQTPPRTEKIRNELERIKNERGTEHLHKMLSKIDPQVADRLKKSDATRIIRALEVKMSTGISIDDFHARHKFQHVRYNALKVGLEFERASLYERINNRVDEMFVAGLVDEFRSIRGRFGENAKILDAVGYKELKNFGDELSYAKELIKQNTRRFAKRQLTWFRADKDIMWFKSEERDKIKKVVANFFDE